MSGDSEKKRNIVRLPRTGTPIAGALLTSSFDWWKPILFAGLVVAFASGCYFIARLLLSREKGTVLV